MNKVERWDKDWVSDDLANKRTSLEAYSKDGQLNPKFMEEVDRRSREEPSPPSGHPLYKKEPYKVIRLIFSKGVTLVEPDMGAIVKTFSRSGSASLKEVFEEIDEFVASKNMEIISTKYLIN